MDKYVCLFLSEFQPHGPQTKSCNFNEILKAQKLKISCRLSSKKIFYYFAPLGFGIAEYNDWPIIEKKKRGGGFVGSVLENGCKSPKMKSIVPDLSEKIMACMCNDQGTQSSILSRVSFNSVSPSFNKHCFFLT